MDASAGAAITTVQMTRFIREVWGWLAGRITPASLGILIQYVCQEMILGSVFLFSSSPDRIPKSAPAVSGSSDKNGPRASAGSKREIEQVFVFDEKISF